MATPSINAGASGRSYQDDINITYTKGRKSLEDQLTELEIEQAKLDLEKQKLLPASTESERYARELELNKQADERFAQEQKTYKQENKRFQREGKIAQQTYDLAEQDRRAADLAYTMDLTAFADAEKQKKEDEWALATAINRERFKAPEMYKSYSQVMTPPPTAQAKPSTSNTGAQVRYTNPSYTGTNQGYVAYTGGTNPSQQQLRGLTSAYNSLVGYPIPR
jgi:hypothetical protein